MEKDIRLIVPYKCYHYTPEEIETSLAKLKSEIHTLRTIEDVARAHIDLAMLLIRNGEEESALIVTEGAIQYGSELAAWKPQQRGAFLLPRPTTICTESSTKLGS